MSASKTETALAAIAAGLVAAAAVDGAIIPLALRNEALPARLVDGGDDLFCYLNVWDGDTEIAGEMLGADVIADGFELQHTFEIEWIVAGGTAADREARFDLGVSAIAAAVRATSGLDGVIERITVTGVSARQKELAEFGVPNAKGCAINVRLEFISSTIR